MPDPARQPLRFEPFLRPMVWGARNLARYLGKNLPTAEPYGESWEVSDHPIHRSVLATASSFGVTLRQLMEQQRDDLLGQAAKRYDVFPWLIKLLDASDWLSVQVHPDEDAVKKLLPGEGAKTEAWFVLTATPESRIYAGLKPGIGPAELRQAIEAGKVTDCLYSFAPMAGDFIHLPAGTVHALGGGVFIAEIQQTSDATFRLFDWNRRDVQGRARQLHLDQGLASIHWTQGGTGVSPVRTGETPVPPDGERRQHLVACPYYEIDHVRFTGTMALGGVGRLQALIVADGQGRFDNGEFVMAGDAWLLPAAMPSMALHLDMPLSGLLCTLPETPA